MKKLFSVLTAVLLVFGMSVGAHGEDYSNITDLGLSAQSVILVEASGGSVLYENNSDEKLPPASITKVMTLLLIYEAVRDGKINWDDNVTVSAHAASMGGLTGVFGGRRNTDCGRYDKMYSHSFGE